MEKPNPFALQFIHRWPAPSGDEMRTEEHVTYLITDGGPHSARDDDRVTVLLTCRGNEVVPNIERLLKDGSAHEWQHSRGDIHVWAATPIQAHQDAQRIQGEIERIEAAIKAVTDRKHEDGNIPGIIPAMGLVERIRKAKDLLYNAVRDEEDADPRVVNALELLLDVLGPMPAIAMDGLDATPKPELVNQVRHLRSWMLVLAAKHALLERSVHVHRVALERALSVWSPFDPRGSGADGETWAYCRAVLEGREANPFEGSARRASNIKALRRALDELTPEERESLNVK
jgi:hypothetical protein